MARGWPGRVLQFLEPRRVLGAWEASWRAVRHEAAPFYGYCIFVFSTLISLATYSSTIDCLGLFFGSFVDDLELSRCANPPLPSRPLPLTRASCIRCLCVLWR